MHRTLLVKQPQILWHMESCSIKAHKWFNFVLWYAVNMVNNDLIFLSNWVLKLPTTSWQVFQQPQVVSGKCTLNAKNLSCLSSWSNPSLWSSRGAWIQWWLEHQWSWGCHVGNRNIMLWDFQSLSSSAAILGTRNHTSMYDYEMMGSFLKHYVASEMCSWV